MINIKKDIFFILLGMILSVGVVSASKVLGSNIIYDNSNSTLNSTNIQDSIDELVEKSEDFCPHKYMCYEAKKTPEVGDYVIMTPTLDKFRLDESYDGFGGQYLNLKELNLWRVLRVNKDGTIEMISEYASTIPVVFYGMVGYQNYLGALNIVASKYENDKYTIGSRYPGYTDDQTEFITDTTYFTTISAPWKSTTESSQYESFGGGCENYDDYNLIKEVLGTTVAYEYGTSSPIVYLYGSRSYSVFSSSYSSGWNFYTKYIYTDGTYYNNTLYYNSGGRYSSTTASGRIRPIVILRNDIDFTPSLGTLDAPFVLE